MSQVDEIKSKLDIVDVISEYVPLKPVGVNYRALCPFHSEKTPSFTVSPERQIWHCFGCNAGGDVFTFIMQIENIEFPEALRILAQKSGVKLTRENARLKNQRNVLRDILNTAADYWHHLLIQLPEAKQAREYLQKRGITQKALLEFRMGYARNRWEDLLTFLKKKKYSENDIFLAGLVVKKERGAGFYDRFRNRLIFPITDIHGNVIGFGGRSLPESGDIGGKYINTPQTELYNKSRVLFNIARAKGEIKKADSVILVEGYFDVVASWMAGVRNVVATCGTALAQEHIDLLKRYTNNFIIAFDADPAGDAASLKGIEKILGSGINLSILTLPAGKDPDECIRKDPQQWIAAVKQPKNFMEYMFEKVFSWFSPQDVQGKKAAVDVLLPLIAKISHKIEQSHWIQKLSSTINVEGGILYEMMGKIIPQKSSQSHPTKTSHTPPKDLQTVQSERLLALVFRYPRLLPKIIERCDPDYIKDEHLNELYKKIIIYYTQYIHNQSENAFEVERFLDYLNARNDPNTERFEKTTQVLIMLAENIYAEFDSLQQEEEAIQLIAGLRGQYLRNKLQEINSQIAQAEERGDESSLKKLAEIHRQIMRQMKD